MLRKLPVGQLRANETLARLQQAMGSDFNRGFGGPLAPRVRRRLWTERALSNVVLANVAQNLVQRAEEVAVFIFLDALEHLQ